MTITNAGIQYNLPKVFLLQESGIGTSEVAARTAYNSFDKSENIQVKVANDYFQQKPEEHHTVVSTVIRDALNGTNSSDLLDQLAWVHHHHSVLEHCNLTYLIKGTSRGVLQELVRHRIASYTVRSTRYTMQSILNAFIISYPFEDSLNVFVSLVPNFSVFQKDSKWFIQECSFIHSRLRSQLEELGSDEFFLTALSKEAFTNLSAVNLKEGKTAQELYDILEASKTKRNVGDAFKHIVTDNWYTDLVMTMNLRSLKNFYQLRDSGAAYFLIRELAKQMKLSTPDKYLNLIVKQK